MRARGPKQLFGLIRCWRAATQALSRPRRPRGDRSAAPRFASGVTCSRGDSEDTRGGSAGSDRIGLETGSPPLPTASPPARRPLSDSNTPDSPSPPPSGDPLDRARLRTPDCSPPDMHGTSIVRPAGNGAGPRSGRGRRSCSSATGSRVSAKGAEETVECCEGFLWGRCHRANATAQRAASTRVALAANRWRQASVRRARPTYDETGAARRPR